MNIIRKIKAVVKSREIIDNWASAALEYMKGNEKIKIKIAGKEFMVGRLFYANLLKYFYEKEIQGVSVRDGRIVIRTKSQEIIADNWILHYGFGVIMLLSRRGWKYKDGILTDGLIKFKHISYSIYEIFGKNVYDIEVKDKEVVDIGANIADSAIYFVTRGAKRVIGIEPLPNIFMQAIENVKLNNLEGKISLINAAIGSRHGKLKVPCNLPTLFSSSFSIFLGYNEDCEVPILTLSDVMEKLSEPYLLKMDCEGCEFDVILNDYEHVRMFEKLIFEHHAKLTGIEYTKLLDKLSQDFQCNVVSTSPRERKEELGLVLCSKK